MSEERWEKPRSVLLMAAMNITLSPCLYRRRIRWLTGVTRATVRRPHHALDSTHPDTMVWNPRSPYESGKTVPEGWGVVRRAANALVREFHDRGGERERVS